MRTFERWGRCKCALQEWGPSLKGVTQGKYRGCMMNERKIAVPTNVDKPQSDIENS